MTCIDDDSHTGPRASCDAVVMHQMIVGVQNIGPVSPELFRNMPDGTEVGPGAFFKRAHRNSVAGRFICETARVREAINQRLMAFRELTFRKVDSQSFKAAHIKIVNELNDAHCFLNITPKNRDTFTKCFQSGSRILVP